MDSSLIVLILFLVFALAIFIGVFELIYRAKRKREVQRLLNTRVFMVTLPKEPPRPLENENEPPKDYRQLIGVAEQMFASFASLYSNKITDKLIRAQEQISFEIIAFEGLISFYVSCPRMIEEMVERQIHAYYPSAHIEPVKTPNIFDLSQKSEFAAATLKLQKKFVFPLRTYQNLESDSLSALTNAMSKIGDNASAAFQMVIRPSGEEWRQAAFHASKKVQEGKIVTNDPLWLKAMSGTVDAFSSTVNHAAKPNDPYHAQQSNIPKPLTPMQEASLKAIGSKTGKIGFDVKLRLIATGQDKNQADVNLKGITSCFAQFGTPDLNSFKVKYGGPEIAKEYILRRFDDKGIILNTEEIASLFHFPNQNIDTPNIRWLLAKEMAPPTNLPDQGTIMGRSIYRGVETLVRIKEDDRRRHIFMIGKTGVGKTTLFKNMIEQDMLAGKGCCYVDPLGDAIEDLLGKVPAARMKDVIIFDPSDTEYPISLNMLEWKNPEERDFLIQECIEIFYKLFDPNRTGMVGPQWEHWFRNAALTVMAQPDGGTIIDIPRLFTDDAFRNKVVTYVTDPLVKAFWEQQLAKTADFHKSEMYNYFISKFGRFMTDAMMRNIIGQKRSSFDFREAMDQGKILLVNLSKGKIGEINSSLLGMIIVTKIQVAAFSRADIPEDTRRDFYLYVDEFQNFTTDTFKTILSEARKYHLNLNVTNQYIAQLSESIRDAVIGNAGTIIVYRIGAADAEFMVKEFPGVSVSDFTNLDQYNTYVKLLVDGTPTKPFSMKGIKSPLVCDANLREQIKTMARQNFARSRAEVEAAIGESLEVGHSAPPAGGNEPLRNL